MERYYTIRKENAGYMSIMDKKAGGGIGKGTAIINFPYTLDGRNAELADFVCQALNERNTK